MLSTSKLPIMEEEDDELQSAGNSKYQPSQQQMSERDKVYNFSFKMQQEASQSISNSSPPNMVMDKFAPNSAKKQVSLG